MTQQDQKLRADIWILLNSEQQRAKVNSHPITELQMARNEVPIILPADVFTLQLIGGGGLAVLGV